jgi:alpha-tubulin suppressor-like RCC1 family protein
VPVGAKVPQPSFRSNALPGAGSTRLQLAAAAAVAGVRVAAIAAGNQHSIALSEDGKVFAWGHGQFGALGLGTSKILLRALATFSLHSCTAASV